MDANSRDGCKKEPSIPETIGLLTAVSMLTKQIAEELVEKMFSEKIQEKQEGENSHEQSEVTA